MTSTWPSVPLGEVLTHRKEFVNIDDLATYKRPRVRLHAQGIVLRDEVEGSLIKTKKQQVCRAGEFLVAEIDAKVGGFGIVPVELDGAIVSSHYFLFDSNDQKLDRRFLDWYAKTPSFQGQVAAQGSTNYAAIRPDHVFAYTIPLPPLPEQRRIVARIEELAARVTVGRGTRADAKKEAESLPVSARNVLFSAMARDMHAVRLDTVAESRLGKMLSRNQSTDPKATPYLRNANVQWDRLDLRDVNRMSVDDEDKQELALKAGDVLVCEGGDIGKAAVWNDEIPGCIYQKALHRVRVDLAQLMPRFLIHQFFWAAEQGHFADVKTQTTIAHLTGIKLKAHPTYVPPMAEQRQAVAYLDGLQAKVDELKRLQAETQAELDALLPSILDRAFKGELE